MKQAMLTLLIVFILPSLVFAQEVENENTPSEQIYPSIQDDTGSEDNSLSTDQLLQQENQWDEVERIIMGLDEEEYAEVFQLTYEEKVDYLESMKKQYGASIALSAIPGVNFLGIQYYINGDWGRGLTTNLVMVFVPVFWIVNDMQGWQRGGKEYLSYTSYIIGPSFLIGCYLYGLVYSIFENYSFNNRIDAIINNYHTYYYDNKSNAINKQIFNFEDNLFNFNLNIIMAAIPITNLLGIQYYLTEAYSRAFIVHTLSAISFVLLLFRYNILESPIDSSMERIDKIVYESIGYGLLSTTFVYGLFYSIFEVKWYNEEIENELIYLNNDRDNSLIANFNFSIWPTNSGLNLILQFNI